MYDFYVKTMSLLTYFGFPIRCLLIDCLNRKRIKSKPYMASKFNYLIFINRNVKKKKKRFIRCTNLIYLKYTINEIFVAPYVHSVHITMVLKFPTLQESTDFGF